jgi:hypothetical protein
MDVIIIYVDGIEVLAPADCIYIPLFARDESENLDAIGR